MIIKYYLVFLFKNTPNLAELYLGHNNLGYDGGKKLAKALGTLFVLVYTFYFIIKPVWETLERENV